MIIHGENVDPVTGLLETRKQRVAYPFRFIFMTQEGVVIMEGMIIAVARS
jgi:hypothetical protein